jgi:hypothetical protein
MPKSDLKLQGGDYVPVADRITLFYETHPTGGIRTELISHAAGRMIVKASVFRSACDSMPAATGLAAEWEDDGDINAVACLENTETSAIGRALANLGFTASRQRPSAEEMVSAERRRKRFASAEEMVSAERRRKRFASAEEMVSAERPRNRSATVAEHAVGGDVLHRRADEAMDLLDLMRSAERLGLSQSRLDVLRRRILAGEVDRHRSLRLARTLRAWTTRRATAAIRTAAGTSVRG